MAEVLMSGRMAIRVIYANGDKGTMKIDQWTLELIGNKIVASKFKDGARKYIVVFPEDVIVNASLEGESSQETHD